MARTAFDKYLVQLKKAAEVLNLDPRIYERLQIPARLIRGTIRIEMDDGSLREFPCFRSQHNHARGPTQGGTRFDPAVCESEVMFLSAMMTYKNVLCGIMHGGGKGGIKVDKRPLSLAEGERMCRGYIRVIAPWIGPHDDGPAPDVNTGGREMAWFLSELECIAGGHRFAAFTGKPLVLGGSLGRGDATARGAVYATQAMMKKLGLKGPLTVATQGFGNAADFYVKLMSELGHVITSVSDRSGTIARADGFDYADLHNFCYDQTGKKIRPVTEYPKCVKGDEALEIALRAKIFAPAAFEDLVDAELAELLECYFAVELANGPFTVEGDEVIARRGIPVLPDIYASGGGVRVSAAEKIQGFENQKWPADRVAMWLKDQMFEGFDNLGRTQSQYGLSSLRDSAMVYAVREVAEAMTWRGGFDYPYGEVIDVPTVTVYKDLTKGFEEAVRRYKAKKFGMGDGVSPAFFPRKKYVPMISRNSGIV